MQVAIAGLLCGNTTMGLGVTSAMGAGPGGELVRTRHIDELEESLNYRTGFHDASRLSSIPSNFTAAKGLISSL